MAYEVLARKWRPRDFSQVVGQQHVLQVLTKAFENQRLHHAYLFTGTRGVGKTTLARIVAKCLNCAPGVSAAACGECEPCRSIDAGSFPDLIEVDAASRTKVEEMRELLSDTSYVPSQGRYKIYLIDEVHMLSAHSFNALLKTLEEPPEHVKFLLATTDPQKLPATILSRCLQFHLKSLSAEEIGGQLARILEAEDAACEPEAAALLARAADGSMRDALSLLDQALNYCAAGPTREEVSRMLGLLPRENFGALVEALAARDAAAMTAAVGRLREHAPSFRDALDELARLWHAAALAAPGVEVEPPEEWREWVAALAAAYTPADLQLGYQILLQGKRDLQFAPDEQTGFEMTLLRVLCFVPRDWAEEERAPAAPAAAPAAESASGSGALLAPEPPPAAEQAPPAERVAWGADLDWEALTRQLDIRGSTLVLAQNCALGEVEEDGLTLVCDERQPAEAIQERLGKALSEYFGRDIRLRLRHGRPEQETQAAKAARAGREESDRMQRDVDDDPVSRALAEELDARQIGRSEAGSSAG